MRIHQWSASLFMPEGEQRVAGRHTREQRLLLRVGATKEKSLSAQQERRNERLRHQLPAALLEHDAQVEEAKAEAVV